MIMGIKWMARKAIHPIYHQLDLGMAALIVFAPEIIDFEYFSNEVQRLSIVFDDMRVKNGQKP